MNCNVQLADSEGHSPVNFYPPIGMEMQSSRKIYDDTQPLALYIHIPFCISRCFFCSYMTVVGKQVTPNLIQSYFDALKQEIYSYHSILKATNPPIKTIQIGGGTPTMLSAEQLAELLEFVHLHFNCEQLNEIIVEAFPTTITEEHIRLLSANPLLKFNIGVQTFNSQLLNTIGRHHEGNQAFKAIELVALAGFSSVGIDLIYGLPNSSEETISKDIEQAYVLGVDHISLYPLWTYSQSPLSSLIKMRKIQLPGSNERRRQLQIADEALRAHHYERYTAFHYSRSSEHQHIYGKWQMQGGNWLGAGQAAMSYLNDTIYLNTANIYRYIDCASHEIECTEKTHFLSDNEKLLRKFLYQLRLTYAEQPNYAPVEHAQIVEIFGAQLTELKANGLIETSGAKVQLTLEGVLHLGSIEKMLSESISAHIKYFV